jgi:hypothetical protein
MLSNIIAKESVTVRKTDAADCYNLVIYFFIRQLDIFIAHGKIQNRKYLSINTN